jgi:hypothetical protein
MTIEMHDEVTIWRCPSLGGPVPFSYCRKMNNRLPCQSLAGCWGSRIDVPAFLKENYTQEELRQAFGSPKKGRVDTILETLDRTKQK